MNKIRTGDEIVVITGKDKGRRGKVSQVLATGQLIVEGINVAKKHQKGDPNGGVAGGIVDKEMPIQISNVKLWNPAADKGDDDAQFAVDGAEGHELLWFASQELPYLVG